jgi:hypothetical protein
MEPLTEDSPIVRDVLEPSSDCNGYGLTKGDTETAWRVSVGLDLCLKRATHFVPTHRPRAAVGASSVMYSGQMTAAPPTPTPRIRRPAMSWPREKDEAMTMAPAVKLT